MPLLLQELWQLRSIAMQDRDTRESFPEMAHEFRIELDQNETGRGDARGK